jgi:hypothetical protein
VAAVAAEMSKRWHSGGGETTQAAEEEEAGNDRDSGVETNSSGETNCNDRRGRCWFPSQESGGGAWGWGLRGPLPRVNRTPVHVKNTCEPRTATCRTTKTAHYHRVNASEAHNA